jgi:hypothetical protein
MDRELSALRCGVHPTLYHFILKQQRFGIKALPRKEVCVRHRMCPLETVGDHG